MYGLNIQLVCNDQAVITSISVVAYDRGNDIVAFYIIQLQVYIDWLLAEQYSIRDYAYMCDKHLLMPFCVSGQDYLHNNEFIFYLSQLNNTIERYLGLWKSSKSSRELCIEDWKWLQRLYCVLSCATTQVPYSTQ